MKKATLQTIARDVRAIARSVASTPKPGNQPLLKAVPLAKGEIDIGLTIHDNRPARLILLTGHIDGIEPASWSDIQAFAKKHEASAPSRIDAMVLFARAKDKFKTDLPYWTREECAGCSACAWTQWFHDGNQRYWYKDGKCRACLVRRLPI